MSLTDQIRQMQDGDENARRIVIDSSYSELRAIAKKLMKGERASHTLGATGLLHEALLGPLQRLRGRVRNRAHFYALAAMSMRRILLDHGRMRAAAKRTVSSRNVSSVSSMTTADPALLDLVRAVDELRKLDPDIVSLVEMKHYLGLTLEEIAAETGRPYRSVREDWDFARNWLASRIGR